MPINSGILPIYKYTSPLSGEGMVRPAEKRCRILSSGEVKAVRTAIVDDEPHICEQIKSMIRKVQPDCEICVFLSGRDFLASGKQFDVVFLDIQMTGINGIETARRLRETQPETILIFVTGAESYALEAFDVSAFHYLLKPLEETKFQEILNRAFREAEKYRSYRQEQLFIRSRNRTVNQGDILYIESHGKKVEFHTLKEKFTIYGSMNGLEAQLGDSFYRCHRAYLVNMAYITGYGPDSITLTGGEAVYLTKKKHGEFVKAYMWYLQNGGVSHV